MNLTKFCGIFCVLGAFVAFAWGILNTVYPNSEGSTAANNFVVLIPWLHRLEHASVAVLVYPALFAGLLGFYLIGAVGRGITGKILIGLASIGAILAVLSSAIEAFVLQWKTADMMRDIGFGLILILICPIFFTAAALFLRKVRFWKRFAPILTLVLLIVFLLIAVFSNSEAKYLPFFTGLGILSWSVLGYAVYTEKNLFGGEEVELNRLPDADNQTE